MLKDGSRHSLKGKRKPFGKSGGSRNSAAAMVKECLRRENRPQDAAPFSPFRRERRGAKK
jgi:hypothetical protein